MKILTAQEALDDFGFVVVAYQHGHAGVPKSLPSTQTITNDGMVPRGATVTLVESIDRSEAAKFYKLCGWHRPDWFAKMGTFFKAVAE